MMKNFLRLSGIKQNIFNKILNILKEVEIEKFKEEKNSTTIILTNIVKWIKNYLYK